MSISAEWLELPAHVVRRHREAVERSRITKARNLYRYHDNRTRHDGGPPPFVMWDGEGTRDAGYCLFGNSTGTEICHPYLTTDECLSFIIQTEIEFPRAIHIGFGFNYDVSMIIRNLPWRHLAQLHHWGKCVWKDYEIEHIPHKWFKIKRGQVSAKIYDIYSFFATNYVGALIDFGVATADELDMIRSGKRARAEFMWADIEEIKLYYRTELNLGPRLGNKLRTTFYDAGYSPKSWHGPGA